jgi:hypothetical protein
VSSYALNAAKIREADSAVGVRHLSIDCSPEGEQRLSDAIREGVLRAAWEHGDKLAPIHVIFKEWTRDRMASPDVTIPYHPTAIRFFKERGVWTAAHDQAQQRLLGANR